MRRAVRKRATRYSANGSGKWAPYKLAVQPASVQLVEQSACGLGHGGGRAAQMLGNSLLHMTSSRRTVTVIASGWISWSTALCLR